MLLSDLDGFIAGLHCCPELIPPSEWLPLVWGEDDGSAPFDSAEQLDRLAAGVLGHYNAVGTALARRRYEPLLDIDDPDADPLWEAWVDGFTAAMGLRPDAWAALSTSKDQEVAIAAAGLMMLADVDEGAIELPEDVLASLHEEAPGLVGEWARLLYDHVTRAAPRAAAPLRAKVGRNDPCPCGSGRKYKKCCGAN
jgi:uncharacterized protein